MTEMCQQHVYIRGCGPHAHSGCCCCGPAGREVGAAPWRHFAGPEERTGWLQAYLKDLEAEAEAVKARIAEVESRE